VVAFGYEERRSKMKHTTEEIGILERWVEALESGNYKQCRGELRSDTDAAFCCLGVLVEIEQAWEKPEDAVGKVYKCAGLGKVTMEYGTAHYIHMNDNEEASFEEIAADIRLRHLGDRR